MIAETHHSYTSVKHFNKLQENIRKYYKNRDSELMVKENNKNAIETLLDENIFICLLFFCFIFAFIINVNFQ